MTDTNAIRQALGKLDDDGTPIFDPTNDEVWTSDGSPRMDVLESILGDKSVKRSDVTEAAPHFNRENPVVDHPAKVDPEEPDAVTLVEQQPNDLEVQRNAALEAVGVCQRTLAQAQLELSKAQAAADAAEEALAKSREGRTSQHDIMDFIKSQHQQRMDRAMAHQRVLDQGLNLEALGPSPLDKAMARKTGFGSQRPARTPKE